MKSILFFAVTMSVFFVAASCESVPAEVEPPREGYSLRSIEESHIPYSILVARGEPGDTLIGIGSTRAANQTVARRVATLLALGDISTQLQAFVTIIINEYALTSENDNELVFLFKEAIIQVLSQTTIRGATVVYEFMDDYGYYWVVAMLDRDNSVMEIESAAVLASMQVPVFNADIFAVDRVNRFFD